MHTYDNTSCPCQQRVYRPCARCHRLFLLRYALEKRQYCSHTCQYPSHAERFWSKVRKTEGCWLWVGNRVGAGYGLFKFGGRMLMAHRIVWTLTHGEAPPEGHYICHTCDCPSCVRPDHLFLGTPQQNVNDKMAKGRFINKHLCGHRGEKHPSAKLTEDQVREIRRRGKAGEGPSHLAREYGLNPTSISMILTRRNWKHIK